MDRATRHLMEYARYHRDPRNVATHFIGIPLIAFGIAALLTRWQVDVGGWRLGADTAVWALTALWYLRQGRWSLTAPTIVALGGLVLLVQPLGDVATPLWLAWALGSFVVGWVFQAVGHVWEGRKPAFFDDVRGLLVGPLFLVGEIAVALGLQPGLREQLKGQA
ncbi:Mpo1 family 2-hydroxy fatty acid dioxygenase [Hydrogenophaga electricum]|nr:Mpo1-like protein [Hydrogenophaga electricum]